MQVCKAIKRVDKAFREHGLQQFHTMPRPHASVLWMLGSATHSLQAALPSQGSSCQLAAVKQALESLQAWTFPVDKILCKIGHRVTSVWCSKQPKHS